MSGALSMRALVDRARVFPQSIRFGLAGGFAAGLNWLVRFPLSTIMPFVPAVLAAAAIGMFVGFLTYRTFVFPGSSRPTHQQIRDFLLINALTLLVVAFMAPRIRDILLSVMDLWEAEAAGHGFAIAIAAVLNFLGHRAVTFQVRP